MNVRCSLDLASACSNTTDQQLPTLTAQSLHSERYNNKSRAQKKPGTGPAPSAWQRGRGSWLVRCLGAASAAAERGSISCIAWPDMVWRRQCATVQQTMRRQQKAACSMQGRRSTHCSQSPPPSSCGTAAAAVRSQRLRALLEGASGLITIEIVRQMSSTGMESQGGSQRSNDIGEP